MKHRATSRVPPIMTRSRRHRQHHHHHQNQSRGGRGKKKNTLSFYTFCLLCLITFAVLLMMWYSRIIIHLLQKSEETSLQHGEDEHRRRRWWGGIVEGGVMTNTTNTDGGSNSRVGKVESNRGGNKNNVGTGLDHNDDEKQQQQNQLTFHFVVSSDCSSFQRWQVLTQIHSARSVNQTGRYTWIISGCEGIASEQIMKGNSRITVAEATEDIKELVRDDIKEHFGGDGSSATTLENDREIGKLIVPHVHFTPDFSNMSVYGGPYADGKVRRQFVNKEGKVIESSYQNKYKFNNKPNGLRHWSTTVTNSTTTSSSFDSTRNEAIVLIDPDFIFLRAFDSQEVIKSVRSGNPAASKYGLGSQWLDFNLTHICGANSLCSKTTPSDASKYYANVGPPYIIHASDIIQFSKRWSELVPPTYDEYPLLYAEMFAYSMAAADLNLKHTLITGLMAGCMIGWPKQQREAMKESAQIYMQSVVHNDVMEGVKMENANIDSRLALAEPLSPKEFLLPASSCFLSPMVPPTFLHYCRRYSFSSLKQNDRAAGPRGGEGEAESNAASNSNSNQQQLITFRVAKRAIPHNVLNCSRGNGSSYHDHDERNGYVTNLTFVPAGNLYPKRTVDENNAKLYESSVDQDWHILTMCSVIRAVNYARYQHCFQTSNTAMTMTMTMTKKEKNL